jgi:hypothetical protein
MKKYRLIGWAKTPRRSSRKLENEEYLMKIQEFKMMQRDDDFAIDMLLTKYVVDSDDYIYEDCVSEYILDEDTDGIYLYHRVNEKN